MHSTELGEGQVQKWTSPRSSGRKFIPESCAKKGQFLFLYDRKELLRTQLTLEYGVKPSFAIIRPPYKIQNPSEHPNTPRNTPQIPPSKTEIQKKYGKYTKIT